MNTVPNFDLLHFDKNLPSFAKTNLPSELMLAIPKRKQLFGFYNLLRPASFGFGPHREEILSFGNSKRAFGERQNKKKKQDFHRHKIKLGEARENHDLISLKERTILSLVHLGDQRFSQEPGGYSFENWMKSFNTLLDEFEDQAGRQNLSNDYFAKRQELTSLLTKSGPSSELDSEISKLRDDEQELKNALESQRERRRVARESEERRERIKILEDEKDRNVELLEKAKNALAQKRKEIQDSSKLLKRIFGTPKPIDPASLQTLEDRVKDNNTKIDGIEKKISEQRSKLEFAESKRSSGQQYSDSDELQAGLEAMNLRLQELESRKLEDCQLLDQRRVVTSAMRDAISKLEERPQASVQSFG